MRRLIALVLFTTLGVVNAQQFNCSCSVSELKGAIVNLDETDNYQVLVGSANITIDVTSVPSGLETQTRYEKSELNYIPDYDFNEDGDYLDYQSRTAQSTKYTHSVNGTFLGSVIIPGEWSDWKTFNFPFPSEAGIKSVSIVNADSEVIGANITIDTNKVYWQESEDQFLILQYKETGGEWTSHLVGEFDATGALAIPPGEGTIEYRAVIETEDNEIDHIFTDTITIIWN